MPKEIQKGTPSIGNYIHRGKGERRVETRELGNGGPLSGERSREELENTGCELAAGKKNMLPPLDGGGTREKDSKRERRPLWRW